MGNRRRAATLTTVLTVTEATASGQDVIGCAATVTGLDQMGIGTHDEVHTSVLRNLLFADGFESGDTSQWSEEEP